MPCTCRRAGLALLLALAAGPGRAALVINEILPDPAGSDAGHEFVEFLNTSPEAFDLEGVEFQFANGAEGPVWRTRWRGEAGLAVPPQGRFLLVDRLWADAPPGDAAATLDLQNGPDAVRLVRGGEVLDLLGYGALTDPELSEGDPAALEPGLALARRPDGADTGRNGADFVAAAPTPGRPNFRAWSAAPGTPALEPPSLLRSHETVTVRLTVANDGLEAWGPTDLRLAGGGGEATVRLDGLPSGAERSLAWTLRPAHSGAWPLEVAVRPPGAPDTLRLDAGRLQVGPAVLVLSEVLAAPDAGQGEWVEVQAVGPTAVDLEFEGPY